MNEATEPAGTEPWWRNAVIYQVYVRSFADSDGDGTGDINGIRSKLPYLAELGVDGLWVNPWYASPLRDGGYDVADYRSIEPIYGTIDDATAMIEEAHELGIRVLVDLVPNHTSSDHKWFIEASAAPIGDRSRDRYIIRDGTGVDGSEPPNNWTSVFGGSAWERLPDGQWYLHLFDTSQPDLNWTNPEVQDEFRDIFRFWLDRGADGFRVDVAHGMAKDMSFPDAEATGSVLSNAKTPNHPYWDRDDLHVYVRQWREVLDAYNDRMMVAEAWVAPDRLHLYLRPDEYHQSFAFDFLQSNWDREELETNVQQTLAATGSVGSVPTWTLSNHDVMRHPTRYGLPNDTKWRTWPLDGPHDLLDAEAGLRRARAGILFMLALPGSVYLYQGEELGLPEVYDLDHDVLDDPVWTLSGNTQKGRDGCRVPIPWERTGPSLGFSSGEGWLPQPDYFADLSAESQKGVPGSTLELYRSALTLRRQHLPSTAEIEWDDSAPGGILGFSRPGGLRCWVNFGPGSVGLPDGADVVLTSESDTGSQLAVDTAAWFV
ncbi:MAG: glycoside hydrolase family 13 protein [Acidimicrobiales bacterium]|nr:glycoside hydrolase family 13 protein [Acidimicrobiales bacterium]